MFEIANVNGVVNNRGKRGQMRRVLVAPDSFKGSLTAREVCEITARAIKSISPTCIVDEFPMADGGEGTVEVVVFNEHGDLKSCLVEGPLGTELRVNYGIINGGRTAIMEMAAAAGLTHVSFDDRDPLATSTIGVGQMIIDALDHGCQEILLGVGGSATNDGGLGMLSALGYQFFDINGQLLRGCGKSLLQLEKIDNSAVDKRLKDVAITVACDVDNPLVGKKGATYVFGPQKGGTPEVLEILEAGMVNFAQRIEECFNLEVAYLPRAGAAGGLGAGLLAFLGAKLESGFKLVSEAVGLEEQVKCGNYDLIITGEGQIDKQTLNGKLPLGISILGQKYEIPVVGIVGSIGEGYEPIMESGMTGLFSILDRPTSLETAMSESRTLLYNTIRRVYSFMNSMSNFP